MDHDNLLLPQDIKVVPLERARVVRPGAVGDAIPGVAYEAALAQFVTAAGALWASTVSARAAGALLTSTVSARLMKSTASAGAPVSCGGDNVRLWPGASTATTRMGTASSSFFARVATTRNPSRSTG